MKPILIAILIVLAVVFGWLAFRNTEAKEYVSLEECFVRAPYAHYVPQFYTLGSLIEEKTEKMDRIIICESQDDCTAENPESGAYGRCQFMKGTRAYVEKKWGLKIDWNDPEQQGYACERLLREEGDIHWLDSIECWDN